MDLMLVMLGSVLLSGVCCYRYLRMDRHYSSALNTACCVANSDYTAGGVRKHMTAAHLIHC